jgi:hypothetical protein
LARAALRRAWSSDSAIRDFVGLSENSWDFNAPEAMPGFGPIDKEEIGRLVKVVLGEPDATTVAARPATLPCHADTLEKRAPLVEEVHAVDEPATLVPGPNEPTQESNTAKPTNDATPILTRRGRHGSAFPE